MPEEETSYVIQMEVWKYEMKKHRQNKHCEKHGSLISSLNWIWTHRTRKWSAATCLRLSDQWVKVIKAVKFADSSHPHLPSSVHHTSITSSVILAMCRYLKENTLQCIIEENTLAIYYWYFIFCDIKLPTRLSKRGIK